MTLALRRALSAAVSARKRSDATTDVLLALANARNVGGIEAIPLAVHSLRAERLAFCVLNRLPLRIAGRKSGVPS